MPGTLEVPAEAVQPVNRSVAGLNFKSTGDLKTTLAFFQKQFSSKQWKETNPAFLTATSGSVTFGKDGYHVSFFAMKDVDKKAGDRISVTIINLGNLDTRKLPVPEKSRVLISSAINTHYILESMNLDEDKKVMREKLLSLGWEPFGKAADIQYFKKNAVKLDLMVSKSPSQGGKTAVRYSSRLLSIDVPAPVEASLVQYHDMPTQVMVVTKGTVDEIASYYTKEMPKRGWKPVSEQPTKEQTLWSQLFRNSANETLRFTYQQVRTDVHVKATLP